MRGIDWQRTVGQLGALLREARLVKELRPAYNRQLRRPESLCGFVFDMKRLRLALGKCAGVCAGRESIHVHHGRVAEALARLKALEWPHAGPLGIVEHDRNREATEVHVVDRWCYLGTASSDGELAELLDGARRPCFDYDHYKILARHLGKKGVRTMPLAACTAS